MPNKTATVAVLAASFAAPWQAVAAPDKDLAEIRAQIAQMKKEYEARLAALEQRLQETQAALAQAQNAVAQAQQPAAPPTPAPAAAPAANAFNPAISVVLTGNYANLSQDPHQYRIQGFPPPPGDVAPGPRGFNLGESELTMAASIDPLFSGQATWAVTGEDTISVEEAFGQTRALGHGLNVKFGRFLSSLGYLNGQHAHAWDFVDAPLVYQAMFGGQYAPDGVQLRWLAPTETFAELGVEFGSGRSFPGNDRNKNGLGSTTVIAHVGGDLGESASWRAGLSWLETGSIDRSYEENGVLFAFSGRSRLLVADGIYKWAPQGNPTQRNFKLQGEYLRRSENGGLAAQQAGGAYRRTQSGWYLQAVFQYMPTWRVGLRYDHLVPGAPNAALLAGGAYPPLGFPAFSTYSPSRGTVMLDWSPSEFSRLRLQWARDKSRAGAADNQLYLQYILSMGTHAAHAF
jgi:hypothetical protein